MNIARAASGALRDTMKAVTHRQPDGTEDY